MHTFSRAVLRVPLERDLVILFLKPIGCSLLARPPIRVRHHPRRLIHRDDIGILVENRKLHTRHAKLSENTAVDELDERMHDALRVNDDLDPIRPEKRMAGRARSPTRTFRSTPSRSTSPASTT